ncbi:hypothetical protein ACFQ61_09455 [Streptomyces sp. NPDC056500]|uniref:hypothetical protein n=1 Tax=Streptomyces sp. NPDC056500 TaxID=3345840 RepID=UPI00368A9389
MAGLTAIATLASSVPAHAEGSRATYIRGWQWGQESGRWRDNHNDAVSTRVAFETCSADTTTFSAPLVLYRVRPALPDVGHGTRINTCNVSNWGTMTTSGDYYFAYTGTRIISVNDVGIYW